MDSGETSSGATSPFAAHRVSNRAWTMGFAMWVLVMNSLLEKEELAGKV
jgi:hypothetical protein